jgi:hypothetical protein
VPQPKSSTKAKDGNIFAFYADFEKLINSLTKAEAACRIRETLLEKCQHSYSAGCYGTAGGARHDVITIMMMIIIINNNNNNK